MSDDVIKNPRRLVSTPIKVEPEHVRMGIDVPEAPQKFVAPQAHPNTDDSFMGIDSSFFDENGEVSVESGHIIDNNDFVSFGVPTSQSPLPKPSVNEKINEEENVDSPKVGDYILMVFGKLITAGSVKFIESKVKDIMYGDDPSFSGLDVSADDIVVLKRVNIKVGIFIDE